MVGVQREAWVVVEFIIKSAICIKCIEGGYKLWFLSQNLLIPVKPCRYIAFIRTLQSYAGTNISRYEIAVSMIR